MFKKIICTLLALTLTFSLTACSSSDENIRVASLKGPTSIGLLKMMNDSETGKSNQKLSFEIAVSADEILPKMISGDLDIALVPANVASVLYNKTEGKISVIDINTLGVLYAVSEDTSISSISDLSGKTVYLTGKGTTPDYVMTYLLDQAGIKDFVTLEFKSEATEVISYMANDPGAIGILPQPFVTAACTKNEALNVVLDLTAQWDSLSTGGTLVTGVTIARNDFISENPKAIKNFLKAHKESSEYANTNVEETAAWVVEKGIIEKEPIAKKAIPQCNITYIDGDDMKSALKGYLEVLYNQNPQSVGGSLPGDDFYYKN